MGDSLNLKPKFLWVSGSIVLINKGIVKNLFSGYWEQVEWSLGDARAMSDVVDFSRGQRERLAMVFLRCLPPSRRRTTGEELRLGSR